MKDSLNKLKHSMLTRSGTFSASLGALGSSYNVCHSTCMAIVSALAVVGITINILPLMFLQTYQSYFWWAAFLMTGAALGIHLRQACRKKRDRNLLILNSGILLYSLPFAWLTDYMDFFRFVGMSLAIAALFLLLFGKRFRVKNQTESPEQKRLAAPVMPDTLLQHVHTIDKKPAFTLQTALFAVVIIGFLFNQYIIYSSNATHAPVLENVKAKLSKMKFTPFDVALAKERMDKDGDGMCDTCGMSIQQCIDNGQLDCIMGSASGDQIGVLGTQHIHADWKIYINGQLLDSAFFDPLAMDMSNPNKQTTSSFLHVDKGAPAPEKTGDVIHMHATNVPLWLFFRSVGIELGKDYLRLADGRVLRNEHDKTLKFFVNGKQMERLDRYVFNDLDKILISYGSETDAEIQTQLNSITNFAGNH